LGRILDKREGSQHTTGASVRKSKNPGRTVGRHPSIPGQLHKRGKASPNKIKATKRKVTTKTSEGREAASLRRCLGLLLDGYSQGCGLEEGGVSLVLEHVGQPYQHEVSLEVLNSYGEVVRQSALGFYHEGLLRFRFFPPD